LPLSLTARTVRGCMAKVYKSLDGSPLVDCFVTDDSAWVAQHEPEESVSFEAPSLKPAREESRIIEDLRKRAATLLPTGRNKRHIHFPETTNVRAITLHPSTREQLVNGLIGGDRDELTELLSKTAPIGSALSEKHVSCSRPSAKTLSADWLDRLCSSLSASIRRAFAETAVWKGHLVLSWLRWDDSSFGAAGESSGSKSANSPLLLIQVELVRPPKGSPHRRWHIAATANREVLPNNALVYKFQEEFGVALPPLPPLPSTLNQGVLKTYMESYENSVRQVLRSAGAQSSVVNDPNSLKIVELGFVGEAIYEDVTKRAAGVVSSPAFKGIWEKSHSLTVEGSTPELAADPTRSHGTLFGLDETQEAAVSRALSGQSLVIQGPPGTGKSQTIAALIVELLREGKTVLFVAEKLAAVEAVTKRLGDKNLLGYVANLHAPNLRPGAAYGQWSDSQYELSTRALRKAPQANERLTVVQRLLDDYFRFMNLPLRDLGMSVLDLAGLYQRYASTIAGEGVAVLYDTTSADILSIGPAAWNRLVGSVEAESFVVGQGMEVLASHPLWEGVHRKKTPKDVILRHAEKIRSSSYRLEEHIERVLNDLGAAGSPAAQNVSILEEAEHLLVVLTGLSAGLSALAIAQKPENFRQKREVLVKIVQDLAELEDKLVEIGQDQPAAELYESLCREDAAEKALRSLSNEELYAIATSSIASATSYRKGMHESLDILESLLPKTLYSSNLDAQRSTPLADLAACFAALDYLQRLHVNEAVLKNTDTREDLATQVENLKKALEAEEMFSTQLGHFDAALVRKDGDSLQAAIEELKKSRKGSRQRNRARKLVASFSRKRKWSRRVKNSLLEAEQWLLCLKGVGNLAHEISAKYGVAALNTSTYWGMSSDAQKAYEALCVLKRFPALKDVTDVAELSREAAACREAVVHLADNYGLFAGGKVSVNVLSTQKKLLKTDFDCLQEVEAHAGTHKGLSVRSVYGANSALAVKRRLVSRLRTYLDDTGASLSPLGAVAEISGNMATHETLQKDHARILRVADAANAVVDPDGYKRYQKDCSTETARQHIENLSDGVEDLRRTLREASATCVTDANVVSEVVMFRFFSDLTADEELDSKLDRMKRAADRIAAVVRSVPGDKLKKLEEHLLRHRGSDDVLRNANLAGATSKETAKAAILAPLLKNTWEAVTAEAGKCMHDPDTNHLDNSAQLNALLAEYRTLEADEARGEVKRARVEIDQRRQNRRKRLQADTTLVRPVDEVSRFMARYGTHGSTVNSRTKIREQLAKPGAMELITTLTPCIIASPDSASMYLPLEGPKFDVLIFDEASQIVPIRAAACLGRAQSVVVAGDSKQLPPTNFFLSSYEDEEDSEEDSYGDSLLDEAAESSRIGLLSSASLLWHYRSRHDGLIRFSNENFYGDSLQWFAASDRDPLSGGVIFHHVQDAVYGTGGVNDHTARRSLELALKELEKGVSVGIVTFSNAQAEYMNNLIMNEYFDQMLDVDRDDPTTGFFVKNLENVQGDERDVIVLDFPYGKKEDGIFSKQFGPLSQREYGARRINVAITRSRNRMHVVSGVTARDFGVVDPESGAGLLRDFLEYAETPPLPHHVGGSREVESPFEEEVLSFVDRVLLDLAPERQLEVHTQVGCRGYRIDMAIYDREQRRYVLGIECDGAAFHSSRHARSRDRIRHEQITSMGWALYHIWGGAWFGRREREESALRKRIIDSLQTPRPGV
jgi:DNA polymerase III delta prime subunit